MKALNLAISIACLIAAGASFNAQAQGVTGSISFTGGSVNDTTSLLTSATFTGFTGVSGGSPEVQYSPTGTFAGVPPTYQAAFLPFTFSGAGVSLPSELWQFTLSGVNYEFIASSITQVLPTALSLPGGAQQDFLNISGTGTVHVSGFTPTPATFTITESGPPGVSSAFNFAETITAVPEPSVFAFLTVSALPFAGRLVRRMKA